MSAGNKGFTLIELVIVVAVVGILAAIAYPSYQQSVYKSRRSDAMAALQGIQLLQEKWRSSNSTYQATVGTLYDSASTAATVDSAEAFYQTSIKAGTANGTEYVALAAPQGVQAGDSNCDTFAIDVDGPAYDHGGVNYADANCWRRRR